MKAHAIAIVAPAVTEALWGKTRKDTTIPFMVHPGRGAAVLNDSAGIVSG
ncbi:MAG TPA: hypothetical protein PLV88_02455 [Methanoregulaceae archaeon]|nr:hypothetical protein [Methanoregulaceae archaeon]HMZ31570.1 hypothetical protein [Methanoregulaceae archaeon]HNB03131.1 hypothetical protein [Methanoregulaceae archaeon]HNJ81326.1 hypothetical protein [Methanoregulaceae archaeon]HNO07564.1 hypothetical protein [Methanoregulaceae archaeon]